MLLPDGGGAAVVVRAYSYPCEPAIAPQLANAPVCVIVLIDGAGAAHVAAVVNDVVVHAEKVVALHLLRTW